MADAAKMRPKDWRTGWRGAVSSRVGRPWATRLGGVFGDPLLHVRIRNLNSFTRNFERAWTIYSQ